MATTKPISLLRIEYAEAAEAYLRWLREEHPEHFMESIQQGHQRKITLESLDLVSAQVPEVQVFNELLIQYPRRGVKKIQQVVPDNMVVRSREPLKLNGSFDIPLQPVGPFWVMEYISKNNKRKDYEASFGKYERDLKVPYLLLFYPDDQELTLYRHNRRKYVSVKPNEHGRLAVPEIEVEVALLDGWVRFWFRGELLPLPADLLQKLEQTQRLAADLQHRLDEQSRQTETLQHRLDEHERQAGATRQELERLRLEVEQLRKGKK
jgi:Uma2 family endonuclease